MRILAHVVLAIFPTLPLAAADERPGRAEASWSAVSTTYQPGKPLLTAFRLTADAGWHTYWDNPGEGGMPTTVELKLPDGWTAGEVGKPVPIRFRTGDLPGFGYEGETWFPVEIRPPAGAAGEVVLEAELAWLACGDDACVPGEATVRLPLAPGDPAPAADAERIRQAAKRVPVPAADVTLEMADENGKWLLTLRNPRPDLDPAACDVFPLSPGVVDPGAAIRFAKSGDGVWTAAAARSEYADKQTAELRLVLVPPGGPPLIVSTGG